MNKKMILASAAVLGLAACSGGGTDDPANESQVTESDAVLTGQAGASNEAAAPANGAAPSGH